jgi:hypothetical protein
MRLILIGFLVWALTAHCFGHTESWAFWVLLGFAFFDAIVSEE